MKICSVNLDHETAFLTLLSSAIFATLLPIEPQDHDQTIHKVPVNELIAILRFYG